MTATAPPSAASVPTAPDRTDRATFSARATAFFDYIKNTMWVDMTAFTGNAYTNALAAAQSVTDAATQVGLATTQATNAATSAGNALTSATNAAASAGAALWVSGTTYAAGVAVRSPATQRLYIKITATAGGAVDPSSNATDWQLLNAEMPVVYVSTATLALVAGYRYIVTYAGVCAMTAPANPNDKDEFVVISPNGYLNTLDFGAKTVIGQNGATLTGVMNLDAGTERVLYASPITKWVTQ